MQTRLRLLILASLTLLIIFGRPLIGGISGLAEASNRTTEILVAFTQNEWWLIRWSDNRPVCRVYTDHPGLPTPNEVQVYCGDTIYDAWLNTQPCDELNAEDPEYDECGGMYLHFIGSQPAERTLVVNLPKPRVWITLSNCDPVPLENLCQQLPYLKFIAEEPLPNEYIFAIIGTIDGEPFSCPGETCEIPLNPTGPEGITVDFWADSSYGDSSDQYQALVRVLDTGVTQDPTDSGWYVDVLSTQWLGDGVVASCAQSWQAFPPVGGVPTWLANPEDPNELQSTQPYAYLAGQLITAGTVNVDQCPSGGLLSNGWANECGVAAALPEVEVWQNQFNEQIVAAAQQARIPSQLIKNLFALESQFWPGTKEDDIPEYGLGRMTELGADTVLLWNPEFYDQFCPLVLDEDVCSQGYPQLDESYQAMLRGALAISSDADCVDCEAGINLSYTGFSINIFAQTITANCAQTGQIVQNATGVIPGGITTYEDLWRFTLVNYHAGPGCLSNAVNQTFTSNQGMNWINVASNLEPGCQSAITFVDKITGMTSAISTPVPGVTPISTPPAATPTPLVPATPTPVGTLGSPTPQETATEATSYPGPPTLLPTVPIYP
jgi:hypothetical protein